MFKSYIVIILVAVSTSLFSQKEKIAIGKCAAPTFSKSTFTESHYPFYSQNYSDVLGLMYGMDFRYYFNKKIFIQSGTMIYQSGYKLTYNWISPSGNNGTGDPAIPLETKLKLNYLSIPVLLSYKLIEKEKLDLSISGGVRSALYISKNEISKMGDGATKNTNYFKNDVTSFLIAGQCSIDIDYQMTKKLFLTASPFLNYWFSSPDKEISSSAISLGGFLSFNYLFLKE